MNLTNMEDIRDGFKRGIDQECIKAIHLKRLLKVLKSDQRICQSGLIYSLSEQCGCPMFHMTTKHRQKTIIRCMLNRSKLSTHSIKEAFRFKIRTNMDVGKDDNHLFGIVRFVDCLRRITRADMIEVVEELIKERTM